MCQLLFLMSSPSDEFYVLINRLVMESSDQVNHEGPYWQEYPWGP